MNLTTKGDLVNNALRKGTIASDATLTDVEPQSVADGLLDLEMMMAEWLITPDLGIDVGYIFSEDGVEVAPEDPHGLPAYALNAVILNLALRILPDYAIEGSPSVVTKARFGKETLVKSSAAKKAKKAKAKAGYPNRMPIGSGNRLLTLNGHNYFHNRDEDNADDSTPPG
ncbi:TPA: recombinase RmuC [Yersinia enterocolitica]|uniref:packaged DNA stabilization gp4 family protein n=1 Tax=Yersinia enterocolitica TaxID=630 RepID=UPI0009768164|nr:packaged DNA stabilization gp4 family protein [Yersinia enterocolitica]HDU2653330.1 recombinase RmuC [Yersinia enterocolitica]HEM8997134.1 recombinase RmuC [Yersinia enterocolitica]HEO8480883.1 recombinase RmuC [Yersinia enterocolitica]